MRDAVVEEIKQRVNIVEVIQEYLPLKKAGTNWKGLCPFHSEKSPSFMVSEDRAMFHCFGCGEGGDAFAFLQKMEGYDFPEVLQLLADRAGVKIERRDPRVQHERNLLGEITDLATRYYQKVLRESSAAESARQYLVSRGMSEQTQQTFGIGFAPEGWESLVGFLAKRGYKDDDIIRSGLGMRSVNGRGLYDRFRKRIMFTIRNAQGTVVGFTGRLLPEDEKKPDAGGKYVNSPETPLYHKSDVLYGLDLAKHEIKKADLAVLVEGNMDVISSHQAGVRNVVAASGTALTDSQLQLLGRYTHRIAVAFDADVAGDTAARRGMVTALRNGFLVKVIVLPEGGGKDPDDCIRKDPTLWSTAIAQAVDIIEYLVSRSRKSFDLKTVEGKKAALASMLPVVGEVTDPVASAHYVKTISEVLGIPDEVVRGELLHVANRTSHTTHNAQATGDKRQATATLTRPRMLSERLMALYLTLPKVRPTIQELLKSEWLEGQDLKDLYAWALMSYTTSDRSSDAHRTERTAGLSALLPLMLDAMPAATPEQEVTDILAGLKTLHRKAGREDLETQMRTAEQQNDTARINEISKLFQEL